MMSYEDLLSLVYKELPHLKGALSSPRVVYVRSQGKVYITFDSSGLVEEKSFLQMGRILRRAFPQQPLVITLPPFPGWIRSTGAAWTTASR